MGGTHQRFGPSIINAYDFARTRGNTEGDLAVSANINGEWLPARPLGGMVRWRAAWLVFTGRADALIWPGQGDK